ncbi:hypothetical protein HK099_000355 [Clydaea vesicula]|uniref:IFT140 first beta-propeller domain-containing protein n=1 Tax=Clydaea vesicula TaxID=447962 RepID=A0AAD5U4A3_9FUNG|nr:hypothetical protein HK099_000355 [Clydaea vesicula]
MSTWSEIHTIEGQYNLAVWHSTFPVLAASTENKVEFFSADGRKSEKAVIKKDGLKSGLISWHPTKKLLASSWSNGKSTESPLFRLILLGTLVIWNDSEQTLREAIGHHSMITCVAWSPLGQRLVTGDADGEVVVWRCDIRGRLISLCQYRLKSAITHCVFRSLRNSEDSKGNESPSFFLASANGSICFADDIGHCSEVVKISSSILALLTLESNDTLIVVNDELLLNQFIFTPEGKIGQQTEFKLSTSAKFDKKVNQICWVGNGLLALSAGRNLKIWDLLTDDSFNLSIPVSCITDSGNLLMWKKRWAVTDATEKNISWEVI